MPPSLPCPTLPVPCSTSLHRYQLVLPKGSQYSAYAGRTSAELSVGMSGLRAFRLPIRQDFAAPKTPGYLYDGTK